MRTYSHQRNSQILIYPFFSLQRDFNYSENYKSQNTFQQNSEKNKERKNLSSSYISDVWDNYQLNELEGHYN